MHHRQRPTPRRWASRSQGDQCHAAISAAPQRTLRARAAQGGRIRRMAAVASRAWHPHGPAGTSSSRPNPWQEGYRFLLFFLPGSWHDARRFLPLNQEGALTRRNRAVAISKASGSWTCPAPPVRRRRVRRTGCQSANALFCRHPDFAGATPPGSETCNSAHGSPCHFSGDGGLTPPTWLPDLGGQVSRPWPPRRVGATPGFSGEKAACRRPGGQKARSRTVLSEPIERSRGHKRPCHRRSCARGNGRSAARNLRRRPDCSGRQGTGSGLERPLVFRTEV